jgi:uncharacterized protein
MAVLARSGVDFLRVAIAAVSPLADARKSKPLRANGRAAMAAIAALRHDAAMTRDELLALVAPPKPVVYAQHKPVLAERFGVTSLKLFGSFARGTAREDSDVDVLVRFEGSPTADQYFGVQFYLEDLLHREVDVVSETALRERLRPYVERDAIAV